MVWFTLLQGYLVICAILFAYFTSTGFTAAQLYTCTIKATKVLMSLRFFVCAYVCGGASPNHKFFKLIAVGSDDDFYWAWNPVEKKEKDISDFKCSKFAKNNL